jgi:hypothetical protein
MGAVIQHFRFAFRPVRAEMVGLRPITIDRKRGLWVGVFSKLSKLTIKYKKQQNDSPQLMGNDIIIVRLSSKRARLSIMSRYA